MVMIRPKVLEGVLKVLATQKYYPDVLHQAPLSDEQLALKISKYGF